MSDQGTRNQTGTTHAGTQETRKQTGTTHDGPELPGFDGGDSAEYFAPEGLSDPTDGFSGYADGRI